MNCPTCQSRSVHVIETRNRAKDGVVRRRYECRGCGGRFTTLEDLLSDEGETVNERNTSLS